MLFVFKNIIYKTKILNQMNRLVKTIHRFGMVTNKFSYSANKNVPIHSKSQIIEKKQH
jgi:hypothetical protein